MDSYESASGAGRTVSRIIVLALNAILVFFDCLALQFFTHVGGSASRELASARVELPRLTQAIVAATPHLVRYKQITTWAPGVLFLAVLVLALMKPGDRLGRSVLATSALAALLSILVLLLYLGTMVPLYDLTKLVR